MHDTYEDADVRVYLDNCCFNRPFDDQKQTRIRLEAEAKLCIQEQIRGGTLQFVLVLHPGFRERSDSFRGEGDINQRVEAICDHTDVEETATILQQAHVLDGMWTEGEGCLTHSVCNSGGMRVFCNYSTTKSSSAGKACRALLL